ncbi:MAG: deoxyribodipyrimidine photo-lyase [Gemmobacter sp.]|nr:deoxyribodipyrimidine photo-lyase [Gemmobacter sp.]
MNQTPTLWWVRRDLRLADNPALAAAAAGGGGVVPVFILDPETERLGAAARWRLGMGLAALARRLADHGMRLILRRGAALETLQALLSDTGAQAVHWSRAYDPVAKARDTRVKAVLKAEGFTAISHPGHLLVEPWEVATGEGGHYKVYSPFWRALSARPIADPVPVPHLTAPAQWPASDRLEDWQLGAAMRQAGEVLARYAVVGENAARDRLHAFLSGPVKTYKADRNHPALDATSRLSENLTWGEIGPRTVWHAAQEALRLGHGCEHFLKELAWREFAWHLLHHTPHIATRNWRPDWDAFPWRGDSADAEAWRRGQTGIDIVDAGMREMYATGTMHNRVRMIVASFLTKHLMTDWRIGAAWFDDCLTDWDPASNAMGWQWVAGSGPDAAPYFRVFNPDGQAEKFDPQATYRQRWLSRRAAGTRDFLLAAPKSWGLTADAPRPAPIISLADGRARALAAYAARKA